MLSLKRMNKRGQPEGTGMGTLLAIIVGVIAVAVVAFFVLRAFGYLGGGIGGLPSEYAIAIKSCEIYADSNEAGMYCSSPKEVKVGSKLNIVNCGWLYNQSDGKMKIPKNSTGGDIICDNNKFKTNQCEIYKELYGAESKEYKELIINGERCTISESEPVPNTGNDLLTAQPLPNGAAGNLYPEE